jgi:hypothetical protein
LLRSRIFVSTYTVKYRVGTEAPRVCHGGSREERVGRAG